MQVRVRRYTHWRNFRLAALIAFGIANALIFRALWNRRLADWDEMAPGVARTQAGLSLLTWLGVAACGRFAGYF